MDLNSIERLQEYSDLPTEKALGGAHRNYQSHGASRGGSAWRNLYNSVFGSADDGDNEESRDESGADGGMDASSHPLMHTASGTNTPALDDTLHSHPAVVSSTTSAAWPSEGCVEFRNITLQYNSNANPVLR